VRSAQPKTATNGRASRPEQRLMSVAEWVGMREDERGELIDGQLVEEEMPDLVHELVVSWLVTLFSVWTDRRGGFVFGSEAKFIVGHRKGRKPDVSVFFSDARTPPARGPVRTPPDLVVEVVSPTPRDGRRDRVEKPDEYAAFGVRFYWIVDPAQRTVEILELGKDGRYVRARSISDGPASRLPGCPGLSLDLAALWRKVDRLGA
jgi:Uma2 family endonuclease